MQRLLPLLLGAAAGLAAPLASQSTHRAAVEPAPSGPVPGSLAGSQRWIAHFAARSFDLEAYRTAVRARRPAAELAAIVADMERRVQADQSDFVAEVERLGGRIVHQYWLINAAAFDLAPARIDAIRAIAGVARIEADEWAQPVIRTATNANNHDSDAVNAAGNEALGVTTACVDTGQDESMAGTGRPHRSYYIDGNPSNGGGGGIGGSRLVVNRQIGSVTADDVHGHGTGVASIQASGGWLNAGADKGHAPRAQIAGYAISNSTSGSSSAATIAAAWQAVAADRLAFNIVSANNSYSGSPNPTNTAQQALDSCAFNADVLICCAAANSGSSTRSSQSVANGLAVAAVNPNVHTVATFSSRGPLSGDTQRFYPDISACGVGTVMAARDDEAGNYVGSGTSMASPQVCGAATLVRAGNSALLADETKAVLLASARDISAQNPTAPYNTRNAYGMGLLRDVDAVAIGNDPDRHGRWCLTSAYRTYTRRMAVQSGVQYQVAITWMRTMFGTTAWADLDLSVHDGANLVVSSATPRNLYEMVRWTSNVTGTVEIRVVVNAFEAGTTSQWFAWAASADTESGMPASFTAYGQGCGGSIGATGLPYAGERFAVDLTGAAANAGAVLFVGTSDRSWPPVTLPFDMGPLGAPGCFVNASGDARSGTTTSASGTASATIAVPKVNVFLGTAVFCQWFHFDSTANALGLVASRGGRATIGYR